MGSIYAHLHRPRVIDKGAIISRGYAHVDEFNLLIRHSAHYLTSDGLEEFHGVELGLCEAEEGHYVLICRNLAVYGFNGGRRVGIARGRELLIEPTRALLINNDADWKKHFNHMSQSVVLSG